MYLVFKVGFLLFPFCVDDSKTAQSLVMGTTKYGNNFNVKCPRKYGISTISFKKTKLRNFDDFKITAQCTKVIPKRSSRRKTRRQMHSCRSAKWFSPSDGDVRLSNTETSCACDEYLGGIRSKLKMARNGNQITRNRRLQLICCTISSTSPIGGKSCSFAGTHYLHSPWNFQLGNREKSTQIIQSLSFINGYVNARLCQWKEDRNDDTDKTCLNGICHYPAPDQLPFSWVGLNKSEKSKRDGIFLNIGKQYEKQMHICPHGHMIRSLHRIGKQSIHKDYIFATKCQPITRLPCECFWDESCSDNNEKYNLRYIGGWRSEWNLITRQRNIELLCCVAADLKLNGKCKFRIFRRNKYELEKPRFSRKTGELSFGVVLQDLTISYKRSSIALRFYVCPVSHRYNTTCHFCGAEWWVPVLPGGGGGGPMIAGDSGVACTPFDDVEQIITAQDDVLNGNTATVTCSDPDAYVCDATSTQCVKTATLVCNNGEWSSAWEPKLCQKECEVPRRLYGSTFTASTALTDRLTKNFNHIAPGVTIAIFCESSVMSNGIGIMDGSTTEGTCQNGQIIWAHSATAVEPFCEFPEASGRTTNIYQNCDSYSAHCAIIEVETSCKETCPNPPDPASFNFVFLVDDSASVKAENFILAKNFIDSFIQQYTIGTADSLTSAITFSNTVNTAWSFGAPIDSLTATQTAIQSLHYGAGVSTDITKALEAARERLTFNSHAGENVVILITDGRHNLNPILPETEAAQIRAMANTIILGVAVNIDDADLVELNEITTGSTTDNSKIISIPDYASLAAQTGNLVNLVATNS